MLKEKREIIFTDNFYQALIGHYKYNFRCASEGVTYFRESMVCNKCGQVWYKKNLSSVFDQKIEESVLLVS